nr:DnaJ domain protein [Aspergillus niger CBS 513.88]|eukprot:XP_001389789.2 DnaJ domain protein [Aspergillus niger CBS 513.88]
MVKADVRRDYYADLGLTPSAETEEIKRQFRKLALKYHPDRNPGKELEFISKFQAIQAANEILSDPQQRLKYDTDRLRAGYGKLYGPPKANTARKAPTNPYASPYTPKPPQPPKPRPQSFHHSPSAGAQRYASYARAAPKQAWEKRPDEGQTRADAYRGFQEMKGNAMPGGWSSFDPRTGYASTPPRPNGQSPRPKSAYEYFKKSPKAASPEPTRTQSAKKKQGFAPRAAGGDEPMAANTSAYTSVPRAERSQTPNSFYAPAPSPTARKSAAAAQHRAENTSTPDIERARSRYATAGGERTFFSSAGLGRSASMRDSTSSPQPRPRTNPPSPTPPESGRHRSASPKLKKDNRNYTSTSSSDSEDDDFLARKPKAVPKSRLRAHKKFSDFHTEKSANRDIFGQAEGSAGASNLKSPRSESATSQQSTPFAQAKFSADAWIEELRKANIPWAVPTTDNAKQAQPTASQRQKSPRKQTRPGVKPRPATQASVATEAEEAESTINGETAQEPAKTDAADVEAMDVDDVPPTKEDEVKEDKPKEDPAKEMPPPKIRPTSRKGKVQHTKSFDFSNLTSTMPFTPTSNGGIDDLQDIQANLPFESRPNVPRTNMRDVRARKLVCPNPPKRPSAPDLVPISAGSQQLGLPRAAWERYAAEMNTYMREWNSFNRRILRHFNARQEAIETGMAPNWISAVGDSARLKVDAQDQEDDDDDDNKKADGNESDDSMVAGSGKAGFSAYLRGLDEDAKVMKHWEVAREMHRECILKLGEMREWILNGGKLV